MYEWGEWRGIKARHLSHLPIHLLNNTIILKYNGVWVEFGLGLKFVVSRRLRLLISLVPIPLEDIDWLVRVCYWFVVGEFTTVILLSLSYSLTIFSIRTTGLDKVNEGV